MNEIMKMNVGVNESFISFEPTAQEEKILAYNAINSPDYKVSDYINKTISLRDVIVMGIEIEDQNAPPFSDGSKRKATRTVLIDDNGKSYTATSDGIYTSVRNLLTVFGTLHFDPAIKVGIRQVAIKKGSLLTLVIE